MWKKRNTHVLWVGMQASAATVYLDGGKEERKYRMKVLERDRKKKLKRWSFQYFYD